MLMNGNEYRDSLRRYSPTVYVNGKRVGSVADEPSLQPGVNALALTYDVAYRDNAQPLALATQHTTQKSVSRFLHVDRTPDDLLAKLELVRLVCQETGCALRYLSHDAINALWQVTHAVDEDKGTSYHERFRAYLHGIQEQDLTLGVAMTDAKGDRSLHPHAQSQPDSYLHIVERRPNGIVISGTKAIVTGAPYVHDLIVMPSRNMREEDRDFAVSCAVPVDAEGVTIVARPAGRPGQPAAEFSGKYGQTTAVVLFEDVFVPNERVFLAGEWEHSLSLTQKYATHHRHTCIGARAGFGDLLIGAGAIMCEENGLDPYEYPNLRQTMVELIKLVESFYACGVAASVYHADDPSGNVMPDPVFANVGKLLLATHIYDMHRLAHEVSGGLIVALPGPDEDHNPETAATLAEVLRGRDDIPYERRIQTARMIEDLTASDQGGWYSVISLHGGGSPEAMKREIMRHYPIGSKVDLVERLLDRDVASDPERSISRTRQPGQCCAEGCQAPDREALSRLSVNPIRRA